MTFRDAEESDRPGIISILKASFTKIYAYYAAKSFESLKNCLVSSDKSGLTGVINWRHFKTRKEWICYLYWLAIRPDRRGKGLGMSLFKHAMRRQKKCGMVCAATEKSNKIASAMLKKAGFSIITRKEMKLHFGSETSKLCAEMNLMPWEDLYTMKKSAGR